MSIVESKNVTTEIGIKKQNINRNLEENIEETCGESMKLKWIIVA